MAQQRLTTSWTWVDDDSVRGLTVDKETGALRWYDQIGCHCTDEDYWPQSAQEFRLRGRPPLMGDLPADVAAELEETLSWIARR